MAIVSQEATDVKLDGYIFGDPPRCSYDGCEEDAYLYGFCFDHFVEEDTALWDAQQDERGTCLAGVGLS